VTDLQAEKGYVLPDYLSKGLRVVFVGTAVGDTSARRRHYPGPNNSFWPATGSGFGSGFG